MKETGVSWLTKQEAKNAKEGAPSNLPEILDGKEEKNLADSFRLFEFKSGEIVIAGTDKGIGKESANENRVGVNPRANLIAIADGVSSSQDGALAAQMIVEHLLDFPADVDWAVEKAKQKMEEKDETERGEAVFISAKLKIENNKKLLEVFQMGDSGLVVISKNGDIKFKSRDESQAQMLAENGVISPDEALYHKTRSWLLSAFSVSNPSLRDAKPKKYEDVEVEKGDMIILASDGIFANITGDEIVLKVKQGISATNLFQWLSEETDKRMQNAKEIIQSTPDRKASGVYSDGYKSAPNQDHRALAIMEIK